MTSRPPRDLAVLRSQVESLAPADLAIELGSGVTCIEPLFEAESLATRDWTTHRREQFAIGRSRARKALERLQAPRVAILFDDEGAPVWPHGIVGSISHKRHDCIVVAARSTQFEGVGVDLELDVDDNAESELVRRVCTTERELGQAADLRNVTRSPGTVFLAAKEAYFKFQFPITRTQLDWDEVEVTLPSDGSFCAMQSGDPTTLVSGVLLVASGWIIALVTKSAATT